MQWAGHAVTDEYLTFNTIEIQAFLDDIGSDFEMTGKFPGSWYIQDYKGACGYSPCPEVNGPDVGARNVAPVYIRPSYIKVGNSVNDLKRMFQEN
jgi:hypothetical protein